MTQTLKSQLLQIANAQISDTDVSHDFAHTIRVLANAEQIARDEHADPDIVIPAALFHDLIVYPKDHPNRHKSQEESAARAKHILQGMAEFPQEKIASVETCILECSFSKGIVPESLESKILQDADGLEATGAISIMRTYASTGQMKRPFYHFEDPFCEHREPEATQYALDLFYTRLLKVAERMHTQTAREIARRRTDFLFVFLDQFRLELEGK